MWQNITEQAPQWARDVGSLVALLVALAALRQSHKAAKQWQQAALKTETKADDAAAAVAVEVTGALVGAAESKLPPSPLPQDNAPRRGGL